MKLAREMFEILTEPEYASLPWVADPSRDSPEG